jgi:hypothetical protein
MIRAAKRQSVRGQMREVAAILSTELGRPISYHPETVEEAYASRSSYGAADWEVDGWVSTYTAIAHGELAGVTEDIPHLTGHPRDILCRTSLPRQPDVISTPATRGRTLIGIERPSTRQQRASAPIVDPLTS